MYLITLPWLCFAHMVETFSDDNFHHKVMTSELPVLVAFCAEDNAPCARLVLTLKDLAEDFIGRVTVATLDVQLNPKTPRSYGVRGVPTLTLFKNGEVVTQKTGALTKSELTTMLSPHV